MKPAEKAIQIRDTMMDTDYCGIKHFPNQRYCDCEPMNAYQAKQCALVAVGIILNDVGAVNWENDTMTNSNYWKDVENELYKL